MVDFCCPRKSQKQGRLLDLVAERLGLTAYNVHPRPVGEEVHGRAHVLTPLNHELEFSS